MNIIKADKVTSRETCTQGKHVGVCWDSSIIITHCDISFFFHRAAFSIAPSSSIRASDGYGYQKFQSF
jgi:hypothetical protein